MSPVAYCQVCGRTRRFSGMDEGHAWLALPCSEHGADGETDGEALARMGTDGDLWAREFLARVLPPDVAGGLPVRDRPGLGTVRAWFANAIEAGRSAGYTAAKREHLPGWPLHDEPPAVIDAAHLARQREWSTATFGPGLRTGGVLDHITKELDEIRADPTDLGEWVDVLILAFDGAWRHGWEPQQIIDAILAKQTRNEGRVWPDWRTMSEDEAIEHDRTGEVAPGPADVVPVDLLAQEHGADDSGWWVEVPLPRGYRAPDDRPWLERDGTHLRLRLGSDGTVAWRLADSSSGRTVAP